MKNYSDSNDRFALAGIGTRLLALIIDSIIWGWITGLLVGWLGITGGGISFFVGGLYNWFFWTRYDGQTPGKRLMNIRVVKIDGTEITDIDAAIRYFGYTVNSFLMGLGWLWALIDDRNQGWHDKLATTVVVKANKRKQRY